MFTINDSSIKNVINKEVSCAQVTQILQKQNLSIEDFAHLIKFDPNDSHLFETLATHSKQITISKFGLCKLVYIPLYISNDCDNSCLYCGYNSTNKISRKTLNIEDIKKELIAIFSKGHKNILIVSSEKTDCKHIKLVADSVSLAKTIGFHSIAVEVGSLTNEESKRVSKLGAQAFVLYQETYNKQIYQNVHLAGKKKDFTNRLESIDRALSNGFRHTTIGFLCGLGDPIYEALCLFEHLKYLKKTFWKTDVSISIPRITDAAGVDCELYKVSDKKFAQILMAYRVAFPEIPIYLSTRENTKLRNGLSDICVTNLSVESKTVPGGYCSMETDVLEQFATIDNRKLDEIIIDLNRMGYDICFKDWQQELNVRGVK
ncbi:radical SAM protein [bacterium]